MEKRSAFLFKSGSLTTSGNTTCSKCLSTSYQLSKSEGLGKARGGLVLIVVWHEDNDGMKEVGETGCGDVTLTEISLCCEKSGRCSSDNDLSARGGHSSGSLHLLLQRR